LDHSALAKIGVTRLKNMGGGFAMTVRSPLDVLAIVLGLLLLVIIVVVGAIVDVACRSRRPGFSFFADGTTTPRITDF
jgi:hypothetical protein